MLLAIGIGLQSDAQVQFSDPVPFAQNLFNPSTTIGSIRDVTGRDMVLASMSPGRILSLELQGDTVGDPLELILSGYDRGQLATVDMNGDGLMDVVTTESVYLHGIELAMYRNIGSGHFAPRIAVSLDSEYFLDAPLAFGDLNGDGRMEVVHRRPWTYSQDSNELIDISNGQIDLSLFVFSVICHDLDDDGLDEIIYGGGLNPYGFVGYWNLAYSPPHHAVIASEQSDVRKLHLADINADGLLDIMCQNVNAIIQRVIYQTTPLNFTAGPVLHVLSGYPAVNNAFYADGDMDGELELWMSCDRDIITVEIDPVDLSMTVDTVFTSTDGISAFQRRDLDEDGLVDLLVTTSRGECIVAHGIADNVFESEHHLLYYWTLAGGEHVCAGRIPGSSRQKPIMLSRGYACYLGTEAAEFVPPLRYTYNDSEGDYTSTAIVHNGLIEVDLDEDGSQDLVRVASDDQCTLSLIEDWKEAGAHETCIAPPPGTPNRCRSARAFDLNDDGLTDLYTTGEAGGISYHTVLVRGSDHTFSLDAASLPASYFEFCADLDHDGKVDLIVPDTTNSTLTIYRNAGSGQFELRGLFPYDREEHGSLTSNWTDVPAYHGRASSFPIVDMDGDGHLEMIRFLRTPLDLYIYSQRIGLDTLGEPVQWMHLVTPYTNIDEAFFIDLDLDGDLDFVTARDYRIKAYVNDGDLPINTDITIYYGSHPIDIVPLDADGDGLEDLLLNTGSNQFRVIYNRTLVPWHTTNIFNLNPNPNAGQFHIDLGYEPAANVRIELIEPTGRLVAQFVTNTILSEHNVEGLPSGLYIIRALDEAESRVVGSLRMVLVHP